MKRFLILAAAMLLAFRPGTSLRAQDLVISQGEPAEVEMTAEELADKIIEYAATFLGTPYRYGANGPKRFDCTGYTRYVFKKFGITDLDRSARDQAHNGREVDISDFHNLQKGESQNLDTFEGEDVHVLPTTNAVPSHLQIFCWVFLSFSG